MTRGPDSNDPIRPTERVIQIINIAMVVGVTMFLAIVVTLRATSRTEGFLGKHPYDTASPLVIVGILFTTGAAVMASLVPGTVTSQARRAIRNGTWNPPQNAVQPTNDEGRLLAVFVTQRIIRLAILEGAAFYNLIVFMLEGNVIALVLAVGLLLGLLAGFPTRNVLERWLGQQLELMGME